MKNIVVLTESGVITPDLLTYINRRNIIVDSFNRTGKFPQIPLYNNEAFSLQDANTLVQAIEFDLMPDNLTMNGTLAPDQILLKQNECIGAYNALAQLFADEAQEDKAAASE